MVAGRLPTLILSSPVRAGMTTPLAYYHNCIKEHMLSQDTYDQKSTVEGEKQAYSSNSCLMA